MLFCVAKMVQPVRDVLFGPNVTAGGGLVLTLAKLHPQVNVNITMLEGVLLQNVAVFLPIAVWVPRLGLGLAVSNTLIGDTR